MRNTSAVSDANTDGDGSNNQRGRFVESENDEWQRNRQGQSSVQWPTIAEFTNEKVGVEKINEYIEKVNEQLVFESLRPFIDLWNHLLKEHLIFTEI
jgi:hypothetical protein